MKLAEALMMRTQKQNKLASLKSRIYKNAVVQDGETPPEDPKKLLDEAFETAEDLEKLIKVMNVTNLNHTLPDGRTLTEALAVRDTLLSKHSIFKSSISGALQDSNRYSAREIKWVATLDVSWMQKEMDKIAEKIRILNVAIQETNWKIEIEEI